MELKTLNDRHLVDLRQSGLNDETIKASGIYSDDDKRIREILGDPPKSLRGWGSGYIIPFRQFGKTEPDFWRVKLDYPRVNGNGRTIKYEQPRGQGNRAYFPPGFEQSLAQGGPILITEGEKKALAAQQSGLPTIGITGVWNFQSARPKTDSGRTYGQRKLIPDLLAVPLKGRQVVICHDSDVASNQSVQMAEFKFAELLPKQGATVLVARIPQNGDEKVGLDDYIVKHGAEAFRKVISEAEPAEKPPKPELMEWARMVREEEFTAPRGWTLRWWRDEYYVYRRTRYAFIPESDLPSVVLIWLDKRTSKASPLLASNVVKCLGALLRVPHDKEMPSFIDRQPDEPSDIDLWHDKPLDLSRVIAFRNGLLDITNLVDMELRPHSPLWFSTCCLPYNYDPDADCPNWLTFLGEVLCEEDKADLLQEFSGLCLTLDTSFQKLLMMVGPKRSGKGTILRIIQHVIGRENVVGASLSSLGERFGLWQLVGKSVCMLGDAHVGHRADGVRILEVLKSIVGEDSVSIDRKGISYLTNVRLQTRFIIAVNELPRFSDASGALGDRLCLLTFDHSFADRMDRKLEAKLNAEAAGILLWSLAGLHRLIQRGEFTVPVASEAMLAS